MARDRYQWKAHVNTALNLRGSIKRWEVLEWLHNWRLLKKGSAPWVSEWYNRLANIFLVYFQIYWNLPMPSYSRRQRHTPLIINSIQFLFSIHLYAYLKTQRPIIKKTRAIEGNKTHAHINKTNNNNNNINNVLILTGQEKKIPRGAGKYHRRHSVCIMAAIFIVCCDDNHSAWEELPALHRRM
jgi:hypothetical protein